MLFRILVFIGLCQVVSGQSFRKFSNEFLNIGVDAASLGMGGAVIALTDDVNSGYWNPAGLLKVEKKQISLMHANYFANIATYNYAAFATPLDNNSALGVSLIRFGVDDILNTTQLIDDQGNIDFDRISLFSAADYAFTVSYARNLPLDGLSIGANAKIIRRIIGDFASSWGFGIDLGAQFNKGPWQIGLMVRDITTTYNVWNIDEEEFQSIADAIPGQNQELPEETEITIPKLQFGIARSFLFHHDYSLKAELGFNARFTQTNDLVSSSFMSLSPMAGFEFGYIEMAFLRLGVTNFQLVEGLDGKDSLNVQPNFGLGFRYKGVQIDYALTDIGDQSVALYSNIFSLKLDLDIFKR
ncbi:MAG: PorV/PorQ family protein [Flavobacteriaceae bacterium]|nr:PorV/PorQ family protein [Flavobacteriaceae bacterium]